MQELAIWQNFYIIVGSAGAVLIGLQFVILALVADMRVRTSAESIGAFGTPTVVHFGLVLFISTVLSAPWPSPVPLSVVLVWCGLGGLVYSATIIPRAKKQTVYQPDWSDWLRYAILPCGLYGLLTLAALLLSPFAPLALFGVAAATVGLLFAGIHNAWDTVTYIVLRGSQGDRGGPG